MSFSFEVTAALEQRDPVYLRELVSRGADVNQTNTAGLSLLQNAINLGYMEVAKTLLELGANPDFQDVTQSGMTPLHYACYRGNISAVKLLLGYGANPDLQDKSGYTPLHRAAFEGALEICKTLIEAGADPCIRNRKGQQASAIPAQRLKDAFIFSGDHLLKTMHYLDAEEKQAQERIAAEKVRIEGISSNMKALGKQPKFKLK